MENKLTAKGIYEIIPKKVIKHLIKNIKVDIEGIHGIDHWLRVMANGVVLSDLENMDLKLFIVFALVHDVFREPDGNDLFHGALAADWLISGDKYAQLINITPEERETVAFACRWHGNGKTIYDIENSGFEGNEEQIKLIAACWDADRLDLARTSTLPLDDFLSTDSAKNNAIKMLCSKNAMNNKITPFYQDLKIDFLS